MASAPTAAELIEQWTERDRRYRHYRPWLASAEVRLIRGHRRAEAVQLSAEQWDEAEAWLGRWSPPVGLA